MGQNGQLTIQGEEIYVLFDVLAANKVTQGLRFSWMSGQFTVVADLDETLWKAFEGIVSS